LTPLRRRTPPRDPSLAHLPNKYVGKQDSRIAEPALRDRMLRHAMRGSSPFEQLGATLPQDGANRRRELFVSRGMVLMGEKPSRDQTTRAWPGSRATTIDGSISGMQ